MSQSTVPDIPVENAAKILQYMRELEAEVMTAMPVARSRRDANAQPALSLRQLLTAMDEVRLHVERPETRMPATVLPAAIVR